jgi:hypothetical protein
MKIPEQEVTNFIFDRAIVDYVDYGSATACNVLTDNVILVSATVKLSYTMQWYLRQCYSSNSTVGNATAGHVMVGNAQRLALSRKQQLSTTFYCFVDQENNLLFSLSVHSK